MRRRGWLAINFAFGLLPPWLVSVALLGQPALTAVLAVPLLGGGLVLGGIYTGQPRECIGAQPASRLMPWRSFSAAPRRE